MQKHKNLSLSNQTNTQITQALDLYILLLVVNIVCYRVRARIIKAAMVAVPFQGELKY